MSSPAKKITVYLLDDHEIVRLGLRDLLESEGDIEVIGESGSVAHAQVQILALRPQVAVLDGRLPDGSGIDVCREIRSRDPSIAALILTSFDDDEALFNAVVATGIPANVWAQQFDTVSVCFSKGLGAPVGSALVGERDAKFTALGRRLATALPRGELVVVPEAGHGLPREAPEAVVAALDA